MITCEWTQSLKCVDLGCDAHCMVLDKYGGYCQEVGGHCYCYCIPYEREHKIALCSSCCEDVMRDFHCCEIECPVGQVASCGCSFGRPYCGCRINTV